MKRRSLLIGAAVAPAASVAAQSPNRGESMADNNFVGSVDITTDAKPVRVTSEPTVHPFDRTFWHMVNKDFQFGFRIQSYWTGTAAAPFNNNDCGLFECWNTAAENSANASWAISAANSYNHIPVGVVDGGYRVGVLGWSVSVTHQGHTHSGTLNEQIGLWGRAGFQGSGTFVSPATARVNKAVSVRGATQSDSGTIGDARAGEFISVAGLGAIEKNYAIYARAAGGQNCNWSFYGEAGRFYNGDKSFFGRVMSQTQTAMSSRMGGNSFEFGHFDPAGYASTIGATYSNGFPFVAFSAEADETGNTFTTRGKSGSVIRGDLAGGIVFGRLPLATASGQAIVESVKINNRGNLVLSRNPPSASTATGETGEVAVDANFIYVCTSPNTWKRAALSSW